MFYIFVEGLEDEQYFGYYFNLLGCDYKIIKYASRKNEKINNMIKSINCIPSDDYIFIHDSDGKQATALKKEISNTYNNISEEKIHIVCFEIESWYYAGVSNENCKKLKLTHYEDLTDNLTKEQFLSKMLRPNNRKYIMTEILNLYDLNLAITRNNSLEQFVLRTKK